MSYILLIIIVWCWDLTPLWANILITVLCSIGALVKINEGSTHEVHNGRTSFYD